MDHSEVDVLVIGAGPAGLAAALELRSQGIGNVLVVDREEAAGGVPRHCDHTGFGWRDLRRLLTGPAYARHYVASAESAGVRIQTGVTVTDWAGPGRVRVTSARGIGEINARAIVLATGCRERPRAARLVPGSRPDGIFTTGSLQRFVHEFKHPVGERAVVVGAEHVSYSAVHTLRSCGVRIAGMVTEHPRHQSFPAYILIARGLSSFPLYNSCRVTKIRGRGRVEAVEITDLNTGEVRAIACDMVVFTGDWIPDREIARKGGIALDHGTLGPTVDGALRSSKKGVFAVGNLVHPGETADTAALSGRVAAAHVAEYLAHDRWRPPTESTFAYDSGDVQWISPNVLPSGLGTGNGGGEDGHIPSASGDEKGIRESDQLAETGSRRRVGGRNPVQAIILRVARVHEKPLLVFRQDGRLLWRRRYRRLIPNLPYRLPDALLERLDPAGGEVHIYFET